MPLIELPDAALAAVPTRIDIRESAALGILRKPPGTLEGRKVGALLTHGTDATLVRAEGGRR